jgi:hypothetical protein
MVQNWIKSNAHRRVGCTILEDILPLESLKSCPGKDLTRISNPATTLHAEDPLSTEGRRPEVTEQGNLLRELIVDGSFDVDFNFLEFGGDLAPISSSTRSKALTTTELTTRFCMVAVVSDQGSCLSVVVRVVFLLAQVACLPSAICIVTLEIARVS